MPLKAPREGHLRGDPVVVAEVSVLCVGPISQEEEVPLRTLCLFALEANERQRVVLCLCEDLLLCCRLLCLPVFVDARIARLLSLAAPP